MTTPTYLIDADVFIATKNRYYTFDICPGFWHSMLYHGRTKIIRSIDKVRSELLAGQKTEDLVQWVRNDPTAGFFQNTNTAEVKDAYKNVILWIQRNQQYMDHAKAKFANEADG